jgi:hypothetical protein
MILMSFDSIYELHVAPPRSRHKTVFSRNSKPRPDADVERLTARPTVEQTRRLVEQDQVFGIFGSLGTPTNASVQRYLNERKVPQMFLSPGHALP